MFPLIYSVETSTPTTIEKSLHGAEYECYISSNINQDMVIYWPRAFETIVYTLRPKQNGHHFADDISRCIFCNENANFGKKMKSFTEGSKE